MNALVEESDWIWMAASSRAAHSVWVNSGENCDTPFLPFSLFGFRALYFIKYIVDSAQMSMHKVTGGDRDRSGNRVARAPLADAKLESK
jgi:hypothetical protein